MGDMQTRGRYTKPPQPNQCIGGHCRYLTFAGDQHSTLTQRLGGCLHPGDNRLTKNQSNLKEAERLQAIIEIFNCSSEAGPGLRVPGVEGGLGRGDVR
jgi:hypothetical protein